MKKINCYSALLVILLGIVSNQTFAQEGLILPMPGQTINNQNNQNKQNNQPANNTTRPTPNKNNTQPQKNTQHTTPKTNSNPSGSILPMPSMTGKDNNINQPPQRNNRKTKEENLSDSFDTDNKPLLSLPSETTKTQPPTPPEDVAQKDDLNFLDNDDDFQDSPNDTLENGNSSDNLIPPSNNETIASQDGSDDKIKVFPKDTGSAIFMVMKSWNCEDYEVVSLINQALDVYGKDAGEKFQIKGFENLTSGVKASVEEEDITFDELLDIIASQTGNDWGCDIPSKTIHIYPKGIKTDSYLSWD